MYALNASSFCEEYIGIIILILNFHFSTKIFKKLEKKVKMTFFN